MKRTKHILLGVTASIAIYKACEIVRKLIKANIGLSVVMTANATRLISSQVFSSLIGSQEHPTKRGLSYRVYPVRKKALVQGNISLSNGVYWDEFTIPNNYTMEHISLAKRADLVLIAPATANIIGKIANGIADDLLSTTVMATKAPIIIAPAMNENMYGNKIVQANIQKLKSLGYKFIQPLVSRLACGDIGEGHLAEVDTIIKTVKKQLSL